LVTDIVNDSRTVAGKAAGNEMWSKVVAAGLPQIGIDERGGGSGGRLHDLCVVVAAFGERGVSVPIIESAMADWVLSYSGHLREPSRSTFALSQQQLNLDDHETVKLSGVPWAAQFDRLVVCGPTGPGWIVNLRHPAMHITGAENVADEPRCQLNLAGVPVERLPAVPDPVEVRDRIATLWSYGLRGAAQAAYDLTRSYVANREQFGAPLIKIPAVVAALARMKVRLHEMDAALVGVDCDDEPGTRSSAVEVARVTTAAAATEIAQTAHQLHGAIGVTEEYPLHRFTRRLWAWRDAVKSQSQWSEALGERAVRAGEPYVWDELSAPR
jgi:acyl-CoA dehydrogenase